MIPLPPPPLLRGPCVQRKKVYFWQKLILETFCITKTYDRKVSFNAGPGIALKKRLICTNEYMQATFRRYRISLSLQE